MYNPESKIMWIYSSTGECKTTTIRELFNAAFIDAKMNNSQIMSDAQNGLLSVKISFSIKVREGTGWTELIEITKHSEVVAKTNFVDIVTENDKSIMITDNWFIPTYNGEMTHGFHGESKYIYQLRSPGKLTTDAKLMLVNGTPSFESINRVITHSIPAYEKYSLVTKSRFCNIDGFHCFTSDHLTMDEIGVINTDSFSHNFA